MQALVRVDNFVVPRLDVNQRCHRRFVIRDKRLWEMKIKNKKFPLDWVHDISRTGLQIRQGKYQGFNPGEIFSVQLRFLGSNILDVQARVKWIKSDNDHMNMNILGIEFLSPQGRPIKKWVSKRMFRSQALQLLEEVKKMETVEANEERKRTRFRLVEWQWTAVVVLPFVAGYMLGFFQ